MLEVRHLCKTYQTKKGVETRALNDVSIAFPETGLVFLLGKSGSGKSTLLNICGGLDNADSGEIVIMGKSSQEFAATDFDSYRNTFVGFVFQEYNILNEFTVEDNIAIALELQNKKRDQEKIAELLKSVDLEEFAKRKPNTLSGGQKQRVAIARALVKEPRIILADEPTGALDSQTGKQVLDTLKKLSADKLVIVVSHDREFAELYADRIIELKDGEIISDISRNGSVADLPNVQFVGRNTISVRDGSALSDEDLQNIKRFLTVSKSGVVVSNEPQVVEKTQKDAAVGTAAGMFEKTEDQPSQRAYTVEERTMIRSHMPFRHAFRMGAASIRVKPVRLAFTIFLSLIAFIVFGFFSTLMFYDEQAITEKSLVASDIQYLNYSKGYRATEYRYKTQDGETELDSTTDSIYTTTMTEQEYHTLNDTYDGSIATIGYSGYISNLSFDDTRFYSNQYAGFAFAEDESPVEILAGRLPENENEAAISDYTFSCMQFGQLTDAEGNEVELSDYEDYSKIPVQFLCGQELKIVGVYAAEPIPERYQELKQACDEHRYTEDSGYEWQEELRYGFYSYLFVDESFVPVYREYIDEDQPGPSGTPIYEYFMETEFDSMVYFGDDTGSWISYINTYDNKNGLPLLTLYDISGKNIVTGLSDTQIALSVNEYGYIMNTYLREAVQNKHRSLLEAGKFEQAEIFEEEGNYIVDEKTYALYHGFYEDNGTAIREALGEISSFMEKWDISLPQFTLRNETYYLEAEVTIGGLFLEDDSYGVAYLGQSVYDIFYKNDEVTFTYQYETKYVPSKDAFIDNVFIGKDVYGSATREIIDASYQIGEDDSTVVLHNSLMNDITRVNQIIYGIRYLSLGLWLGFTLFAILLMFNFISASITAKKKEIGILRAIGARSFDVFKIFWSEAIIVAAICLVLSVIGCAVLCPVISNAIIAGTSIQVTLLVYTPITFVFMLLVAIFTATIATIIPVAIYSKKPPVDSIRAL